MNAGGAGGFTRGLIEVMKLNAGYTRVLFMDDDVEFSGIFLPYTNSVRLPERRI